MVKLCLLLLPLVAACGSGGEAVSAGGTDLVVDVTDGATTSRFTLTCDPPGGSHADPAAACASLDDQSFAPLPSGSICTQVYGGPQTATLRGTYRGQPVSLDLARSDGCLIAQWDRLGALLASAVPS